MLLLSSESVGRGGDSTKTHKPIYTLKAVANNWAATSQAITAEPAFVGGPAEDSPGAESR